MSTAFTPHLPQTGSGLPRQAPCLGLRSDLPLVSAPDSLSSHDQNNGTDRFVLATQFGLNPDFADKLQRVSKAMTALRLPAALRCPSQRILCERLAYRQHEFAPFADLAGTLGLAAGTVAYWQPNQVVWLWHQGDLNFLSAKPTTAKRYWWAASTLAASRSHRFQLSLRDSLRQIAVAPDQNPRAQALAKLHIEELQLTWDPMRGFSRNHVRALRDIIRLDPLQFLARFMDAACSYVRQKRLAAHIGFSRAAVEMQGHLGKDVPKSIWGGPEHAPSAVWRRRWTWLAHAWPHEPLFALAAAAAATDVGDHRAALAYEQTALIRLPGNVFGHQALAYTLTSLREYEAAARAWTVSTALDTSDPHARRAMGALAARAGDMASARMHFAAAAPYSGSPRDAHLHVATACIQVGALEASLQALREALLLEPLCFTALYNMSLVLCALGRTDAALDLMLSAQSQPELRDNPEVVHVIFLQLGRLYSALGRADEAAEAFAEAATTAETPMTVHLEAAAALDRLDANTAARPHFEAVVRLEPNNVEHVFNLATSYLNEGESMRALTLLLRAEVLEPDISEHCYLMATARRDLGHIQIADALYLKAVERYPAMGGASKTKLRGMTDAVEMLLDFDRNALALTRVQAFLTICDDASLHYLAARAARRLQMWDLSCVSAKRSLALDANLVEAWHLLLALPDGTQGKPGRLACLTPLAQAQPGSFWVQWHLAREALQEGAMAQAFTAAERAVLIQPDHAGARRTLEDIRSYLLRAMPSSQDIQIAMGARENSILRRRSF